MDSRLPGAQIRAGFARGLGFAAGMGLLGLLLLAGGLVADSLFSFSAGDLISAGQINYNFQQIRTEIATLRNETQAPVGSIVGWHKNVQGVLSIPAGWVECKGGTVSDPDSPIRGASIPNLNGNPGGGPSPALSGAEQMFLRGGMTSGNGQDDLIESHTHDYESERDTNGWGGSNSGTGLTEWRRTKDTGATGGSETRPKNMSVVWIMRIK